MNPIEPLKQFVNQIVNIEPVRAANHDCGSVLPSGPNSTASKHGFEMRRRMINASRQRRARQQQYTL